MSRIHQTILALVCAGGCVAACGSRSELGRLYEAQPVGSGPVTDQQRCLGDLDCGAGDACAPVACIDGACEALPVVECVDGDPCTEDRCDPASGECEFRPLTRDEDGDGHRAPLPGRLPGAPGACGDDCDDTSPAAHPGGIEVCDGVDNDCNGIIDEDAEFIPVGGEPVRVSGDVREADVGGLAFNGEHYAVLYTSELESWENDFKALTSSGRAFGNTVPVTKVNTDAFSGPVVWTGSVFATAWEDRRDGDYEIYFNRLASDGQKLGPDLRVTNAPDFSLRPALVFDGSGYLLVWGDRRNGRDDYRIYGQRLDAEGRLVGGNLELTPRGLNAEAPQLVQGRTTLGLSFNIESPAGREIAFRTTAPDLSDPGSVLVVGQADASGASMVFNGESYVLAWYTREERDVPGPTIQGTVIDEDGRIRVPERPITVPAAFASSPSLLALGDRLLLVWAEWAEDAQPTWDLFTKMLNNDLTELSPKRRVTRTRSDVSSPVAAFGPEGDVGIVYQGLGPDGWQVYFTRLSCSVDAVPAPR